MIKRKDPHNPYGAVSIAFHWLIVLLLAAQYAVGSIMPHIGRDTSNEGWVSWHLSVGAAILFVIVLRFLWRLAHPVPLSSDLPALEMALARITHISLYALVFVMTLLGWAAANSRGWTVLLFGAVPLPALAPKGSAWGHQAGDLHNILVYVLLALIVVHVIGALYHHFVRRDQIMRRMLPLVR